jgi:hypothetical protein
MSQYYVLRCLCSLYLNRIETWFLVLIMVLPFKCVKSITIESVYWLNTNTEIMQYVLNS